jgi:hypothetical protein
MIFKKDIITNVCQMHMSTVNNCAKAMPGLPVLQTQTTGHINKQLYVQQLYSRIPETYLTT